MSERVQQFEILRCAQNDTKENVILNEVKDLSETNPMEGLLIDQGE
jgi:hypothetical protein